VPRNQRCVLNHSGRRANQPARNAASVTSVPSTSVETVTCTTPSARLCSSTDPAAGAMNWGNSDR
jgi:hypothetical protein